MSHRQESIKGMFFVAFIAAGLVLAAASSAYAQTPVIPPGSGTSVDPYLISELGHLVWMGYTASASYGKYYILASDIDASATAGWNDAGTDKNMLEGFKPIGTYSDPDITSFRGVFDGNEHIISGLVVHRPVTDYVGFFGYIGFSGQVRNLGLVGGAVTGHGYVGGLVGYNDEGTVSNCYATGAVTGSYGYEVGGLVGRNYVGTVTNCYATGVVTGEDIVGGLVGDNYKGQVTNCYATGAVTGIHDVGGLVGYNVDGTVLNCYATGAVTVTGEYSGSAGGLVGGNSNGTISNCYATGAVTGNFSIGGLVGYNVGTVSNCYATGAVTGLQDVGGLIGDNHDRGTVSNCYATGTVTGTGNSVGGLVGRNDGTVTNCYATGGAVMGFQYAGGLVGYNYKGEVSNCYATGAVTGLQYTGGLVGQNVVGTISYSYWDVQTSGHSNSDGGEGITTAEMKQQATFAGWDFTSIWGILENVTYPFLRTPADHGDFNSDGFVSRADLDIFVACVTGPAILYVPTTLPQSASGCTLVPDGTGHLAADFDHDNDVDQVDFGIFQRCYSGEGKTADPNCAY